MGLRAELLAWMPGRQVSAAEAARFLSCSISDASISLKRLVASGLARSLPPRPGEKRTRQRYELVQQPKRAVIASAPALARSATPPASPPIVPPRAVDFSHAKVIVCPSKPDHRYSVVPGEPVPRHFSFGFEREHFERVQR